MSCGTALAQENTSGPYLFDLLKRDAYLSAWKKMLAGETVPAWVSKYATSFDGPTAPGKQVPVGSDTYTLAWVCKTHDCGDNQLHVSFSSNGAQAWGLLMTGSNQHWLGHPDAALQRVILEAKS
jgi:hypothetical protein